MYFPTHRVCVGALVINKEDKILMIKHPMRGWEFPGGHVEIGETLVQALKREVIEETGISVEVGSLVGIHSNISVGIQYDGVSALPPSVNIDFIAKAVSGDLTLSSESIDIGWFEKRRTLEMVTHPTLRDRLNFMLNYEGKAIYRAYTRNPYAIFEEYYI